MHVIMLCRQLCSLEVCALPTAARSMLSYTVGYAQCDKHVAQVVISLLHFNSATRSD